MTRSSEFRTSHRQDVEGAALELIHSVMADDWSSDAAGSRVWNRSRGNRHVLLLLRARVARHLAGRPTPIDERAAATLDVALRSTHSPVGLAADRLDRRGVPMPRQSLG